MKSKAVYPATDYNGIASRYDHVREMSGQNLDIWIREIVRAGQIHGESTVLEVGCGTGRFALALWEHTNARVVGLDASADMLKTAKTKPSAANIEWIEADAETIPYAGKAFDCVFMVFAMHHFAPRVKTRRQACHRHGLPWDAAKGDRLSDLSGTDADRKQPLSIDSPAAKAAERSRFYQCGCSPHFRICGLVD